MLELSPIIKSLWRSKIGPLLIVAQLALSIAIVSNALFFMQQRVEHISRPAGFDYLQVSKIETKESATSGAKETLVQRDVAALKTIPGVLSVAPISSIPFSNSGSSNGVSTRLGESDMSNMTLSGFTETDHHGLETLGFELLEGRNFKPEEITYLAPQANPTSMYAIAAESVAKTLFPNQSAVGQTVYGGGQIPIHIVGVVKDVLGPFPNNEIAYHNLFVSTLSDTDHISYVIRSQSEDRNSVLTTATAELKAQDPTRIVSNEKTLEAMRTDHYSSDYAMIILLTVVISLLIFINMLGIVGITTFWVNQRRKQIGIRRALGATRAAIMRYFLVENALLVIAATALGAMIAFWTSHYLVRNYAFELLPWIYIPLAGLAVLAITLLAAAAPARRAARVSPQEAVANR